MRKIFFFFFIYSAIVWSQTYRISHDPSQVRIDQTDRGARISYEGITDVSGLFREAGAPDLPAYTYTILLSRGETVEDVRILHKEWAELAEAVSIRPAEPLWTQKQHDEDPEAVSDLTGFYPEKNFSYEGVQHLHGHPIAHFTVFPLRHDAETGRLLLLKSVEFEITRGASQKKAVYREEEDTEDTQAVIRQLDNLVNESSGLPSISATDAVNAAEQTAGRLKNLDRYIVITTEELRNAFQPLAEWKTLKGVPARIKTMEEIRLEYPYAMDDAESMRKFIEWSYRHKGTRFILLGGDTDLVPTRIITTGYYTFPTDYYFADLDGSWNADQDDIFGEAVDGLEGYPEVYVSRIPVHTAEDVGHFITRLLKYEKLEGVQDPDYFSRVLYLAANLKRDNDGRDLILNHIDPQINPEFDRVMITQNEDVGSDPQVAINELNKNYGLIFSENHGAYHTIRPGAPGSNIYNYMIEDVANQEPGIWYMASCETNDIVKRAFSEAYMLAPNGGGVAYIGNSSWEYPFSGVYLQKEFFNLIFNRGHTNLGEAHFLSRYPYLGHIGGEGPARVIVFSTVVLGDPEMPVWTESPQELVISHPAQVRLGYNEISIDVQAASGSPEENVQVVLYQPDGIYLSAFSDAEGTASFEFSLAQLGEIHVTALKHNFVPEESTIRIAHKSGPRLDLGDVSMTDISGNKNGFCEPGEEIELHMTFLNAGTVTLQEGLVIEVSASDPGLRISNGRHVFAENMPTGSSKEAGPFNFEVGTMFDLDTVFTLNVTAEDQDLGITGRYSVDIPLRLANVQISEKMLTSTADSLNPGRSLTHFRLKMDNSGNGTSTQLTAELADDSPGVDIVNGHVNYGNLEPGESSWSREYFIVSHAQSTDSLHLDIRFHDGNGREWYNTIDFKAPGTPDGLRFSPAGPSSIELNWDPVPESDIHGYHIHRREDGESAYTQITETPVHKAGYYVDRNRTAGVIYEYRIEAVDSSGNRSIELSDPLPAWTGIPNQYGFPVQLDLQSIGSEMNGVKVHDLNMDGVNEVIATGSNGVVQILDDRGAVLSNLLSLSGNMTTPAVGNVYGDQVMEVVVSAYTEGGLDNAVYVIDAINGSLLQKFQLGYNAPTHVVLDDLDADGMEDIILLTHAGNAPEPPKNSRLMIWKSTGSGWTAFPGWPAEGYVFSNNLYLGNPAVGDMNGDGRKSIIVSGFNGEVYRFQPADSSAPVWKKTYPGKLNSPVSLADLNQDGNLEIIVAASEEDKLYVFNAEGGWFPGWEDGKDVDPTDPYSRTSPAIAGNLDDDAELEVALIGRQKAWVFEHSGEPAEGWPVAIDNGNGYFAGEAKPWGVYSSPVLADMDIDGTTDLIFVTAGGHLQALNGLSAEPVTGFPIDIRNSAIAGESPQVADVDLDGDLEVLLIGHDGILHSWDMPNPYSGATLLQWPGPMSNRRNSATYEPLEIVQDPLSLEDNYSDRTPASCYLSPNYPNPFNPVTTIQYTIGTRDNTNVETQDFASQQDVNLSVYNTLGQKVATLVSEKQPAGRYEVKWNATAFASGIYFYKLETGSGFVQTRKLVLLK